MTDKQIIIDGVDVSGCEHYEDLNCSAYRDSCGYPLDCKDKPNCYYKQLKRKEEKIEKIQEVLDTYYDDDWKATREIQKIIKE